MATTHNRVEVMHGVNFDMLGSRSRLKMILSTSSQRSSSVSANCCSSASARTASSPIDRRTLRGTDSL